MQKSKFGVRKIKHVADVANFKRFSNQRSDYASKLRSSESSLPLFVFFIYIKHLFIFRILFPSYVIRHSVTQSAFKDTQRALEH